MLRSFGTATLIVAAFIGGWVFADNTAPSILADYVLNVFGNTLTATAVLSAAFALLSLFVQLTVGMRQAHIGRLQAGAARISADANMMTAQLAGHRAVASMRLKWVEDLRNILSEYHAILMTTESPNSDDQRKLSSLGTQLDLMLNRDEPSQKKLWEIADAIYQESTRKERVAKDSELMMAGRAVMKAEWEKIKQEMRGTGMAI